MLSGIDWLIDLSYGKESEIFCFVCTLLTVNFQKELLFPCLWTEHTLLSLCCDIWSSAKMIVPNIDSFLYPFILKFSLFLIILSFPFILSSTLEFLFQFYLELMVSALFSNTLFNSEYQSYKFLLSELYDLKIQYLDLCWKSVRQEFLEGRRKWKNLKHYIWLMSITYVFQKTTGEHWC